MDPDIGLHVAATLAALPGAPPFAFAAEDALLVTLLVGLGAAVGAGGTWLLRRRREAVRPPPDDVERRPIRPSRVELTEDPIVVALGIGLDQAERARRRRRRPIGAGLHTPPNDAPPPT
jgi:hypothetical protein